MSNVSARRSIALFVALLVAASAALEIAIAMSGKDVGNTRLTLALMWTPGIASVAVRLFRREGFGDVSFRFGGLRGLAAVGAVVAYPIVVGALAYGIAWASGLATFAAPKGTLGIRHDGELARFAFRLLVSILPGIPLSMISAFGEELGWRGYLLPRALQAGVPYPNVLIGFLWGAWHVPLILAGLYSVGPSPTLSAAVFMASVVSASCLFGWSRTYSGSVWPAVIAHAAWNSIIQGTFDASTIGSSSARADNIWVGEGGLLVAAASALVCGVAAYWFSQLRTGDEHGEAIAAAPALGGETGRVVPRPQQRRA